MKQAYVGQKIRLTIDMGKGKEAIQEQGHACCHAEYNVLLAGCELVTTCLTWF